MEKWIIEMLDYWINGHYRQFFHPCTQQSIHPAIHESKGPSHD